jgi:serine phosphatase RsbU (regulator of sigma subunit)
VGNAYDAHAALTATARLRILRENEDPNEGEPMTVAERRHRQAEARRMHELAVRGYSIEADTKGNVSLWYMHRGQHKLRGET